jgi:uncharacterized protein (DUF1330 family)
MFTIIVHIWATDGNLERLEAFEKEAWRCIHAHQGTLLTAFRPKRTSDTQPDEIHVLQFPDETAFQKLLDDPAYQALADQRNKAQSHAILYQSAQDISHLYQKPS